MEFWLSLLGLVILLLVVKAYLIKGVYQATDSRKGTWIYGVFSIGTLLIGVPTMIAAFSDGMVGLMFWENFPIALMISVVLCEVLLLAFFVIADILEIVKSIGQQKNETTEPVKTRRRFLKQVGIGITALPFASFLYGITKGKYNFKVIEEVLSFKDLPKAFDGFKIVQFSDLHSGGFDSFEDVKRGMELIQAQNADLILFTGDLVNDLEAEIIPYKPLLKALNAPFGKYAVLGNHDYPIDKDLFPTEEAAQQNFSAIHQHHEDTNFHLMNNSNVKLEKDGTFIRLIGVENWGHSFIKEGDLDKAIQDCTDDEFSILMSHDPTHWDDVVLKHPKHIHLTLAGHTHGSQLGLELLGIKWSPIQYFYKRWAGLYQSLNQYLYVNRGFGFIGFAGRVGIPPEITVFTLKTI